MSLTRVNIVAREDLAKARRSVVRVFRAPDGLSQLLWIDRGSSPQELMSAVASSLGYDSPEEYRGEPLGEIVSLVERLFDDRDLQDVPTADGSRQCFVSRQPVGRITGATLLSRLLTPEQSRQEMGEPSDRAYDTRQGVVTGEGPDPREERPQVREALGELRLALPLDEGPALVTRRIHRPGRKVAFVSSRPLVTESFATLRRARYMAEALGSAFPAIEGTMADSVGYAEARQESARQEVPFYWYCMVERQEACRVVAKVVAHLSQLHAQGEVHGDLKPSNVLLLSEGPRCIDSLSLRAGECSPAMTPGWAAPEQILGQPVSPATDQYPIGVMLRHLVGGVMYGEEVTMVVPTGGAEVERFTLLKNPGVYLDPDAAPVEPDGVKPWQQLMARCMAFDPAARFPSIEDLGGELEQLAARYPLDGELSLWLSFGALVRTDTGPPELAWLAYEQAPSALVD
jgi:hypothetical protein